MTDLHARITVALDQAETLAKAATPGPWVTRWESCDCGDGYGCSHPAWVSSIRFPVPVHEPLIPGGEVMGYHYEAETGEFPPETVEHVAAWSPDVVLRHVAHGRAILDRHVRVCPLDREICRWDGIGWPCADVLALAEAWQVQP